MTKINWQPLKEEFQQWQDADLTLQLWWRDDDAITSTTSLEHLISISAHFDLPIHLAIIPKLATTELVDQVANAPLIIPVMHGWSHENHAPIAQKNAEFGPTRNLQNCMRDLNLGQDRMSELFGSRFKPMLVPPWNRISPTLVTHLASMGFEAVSTFLPRKTRFAAPDLVEINTHLDPINWHGGRSLIASDTLVAQTVELMQDRRLGNTDKTEPLGLLTHHLIHDIEIWEFVIQFLTIMRSGPVKAFR